MLKTRKVKECLNDTVVYGDCLIKCHQVYYNYIHRWFQQKHILKEINDEEYFFAEIKMENEKLDYNYLFEGVFLAFNLNHLSVLENFPQDFEDAFGKIDFKNDNIILEIVSQILFKYKLIGYDVNYEISIFPEDYLRISIQNQKLDENLLNCCQEILLAIRKFYNDNECHLTRMFGSYILLQKEKKKLKAIKATPIPIKYCPLMIKLLNEVGGNTALNLIESLKNSDDKEQTKLMCKLINEVVVDGGYFDTNRPLNSCEANVIFGASETISSAFKSEMIDAAVIVSNNLGTIITTDANTTQGCVKRMTGLFRTSPNEDILKTAYQENIIPVFPYTAEIDQLEGVKKAIQLGYQNIAVTLASFDNKQLKKLSEIEKISGVNIYKFGLCSTGIDEETAKIMKDYADVIWSCASKQVKNYIEPNAIAQVGIKIPVHIMTKKGWEIVRNHLEYIGNIENINLQKGDNKNIVLNNDGKLKVLTKKEIHNCDDCPYPCI